MPKVERNVEKLKQSQAKRGVIPSLRGLDSPKGSQPLRAKLSDRLRAARRFTYLPNERDTFEAAKQGNALQEYGSVGHHYSPFTVSALGNFERVHGVSFEKTLNSLLQMARKRKTRVRWLDIGPGLPDNFMPFVEAKDPENTLVDFHTLSPDQLLPKVKRSKVIRLSDPSSFVFFRTNLPGKGVPNENYVRWKDRLTHHVGAIETYNPAKLGGKFHLIVSATGGTFYTVQPHETALKIAPLLARGGKAFLMFKGTFPELSELDEWQRVPVSAQPSFSAESVKKQLGSSFDVKSKVLGSQHLVLISRKR